MGNCCCGEEENGDANERTRLLGDNGRRRGDASTSESNNTAGMSSNLITTDENKALSDILDQTVKNIIDVAQLENTSDQQDHLERAKRYTDKMTVAPLGSQFPSITKMKDSASAERMLSGTPLSSAEYSLMLESSSACSSAVQNISVTHREDLLITFAVNS